MKSCLLLTVSALTAIAGSAACLARESWPAETPEHKKQFDEFRKLNEQAWQRALPAVQEWAKKGKPFIPSAAKPSDLPQAPIPAFYGAQGGGMNAFGGRGGHIYVVDTLADDDAPNTLRAACEAGGPRMVLFNVAGIIHLKRPLDIRAPYLTIAGQSAPGDGVCIADFSTLINAHDVVIRYMRFRRGATDVYDRDDALGGNPIGNIIVDHCSCSWGFDENLSMYRHMYAQGEGKPDLKLATVNITLQWCISSEALDTHNHAFGGTWGGFNTAFHHNLFACNTGRNPSIGMGHDFNFVNNVLFDWRHRTMDGGDESSLVNCINNYYKPGPIANPGDIQFRVGEVTGRAIAKNDPTRLYGKWYAAGNIMEGYPQITADNWAGGIQFSDGVGSEDTAPAPDAPANPAAAPNPAELAAKWQPLIAKVRADKPFPMPYIDIQSAGDAYESVLANAGASLPKRDAVDERIINEVRTGKLTYEKGIITDISQVGGYPAYSGTPHICSQPDGIPDAWKQKYHLDIHDPALATRDLAGDGYTVLDKYLDGLDPSKKINTR